MKRRIRLGVALAALTLHVFAPFAAYASVKPVPASNDLCSVYGKSAPSGSAPAGLPFPRSDQHPRSHCALCPGGPAAAAVLPPSITAPLPVAAGDSVVPATASVAYAAALVLLPPSCGPPPSLTSV